MKARSNNNSPMVSVLIPAYNGEKYIGEAIESVLSQSFEDYELMIRDDCSKDKTVDIIKKYVKKDHRIKFIQNQTNLGTCAKNLNLLILKSSGEYIKILIQDDVISPEYLKIGVEILDSYPQVSLITSYQQFIGQSNKIRKLPIVPLVGEVNGKMIQKHLLFNSNWIGGETATMFRRKDLHIGLFNPCWVWSVDRDLWMRLLSLGNLYVVPKILSFPRVHPLQGTKTLDKNFVFTRENLMQLKVAFMSPELYGAYTREEQNKLYQIELDRLIKEGYDAGSTGFRKIINIGLEYELPLFIKALSVFFSSRVIDNVFCNRLVRVFVILFSKIRYFATLLYLKKHYRLRNENKALETGYGKVATKGVIQVPINKLLVNIWTHSGGKVVPIDSTPHFQWIKNLVNGKDDPKSREQYYQYLDWYYPEEDPKAGLEKVKKLILSCKSSRDKQKFLTIIIFHPKLNRNLQIINSFLIHDGVHRAALAKALGLETIDCRLLNW